MNNLNKTSIRSSWNPDRVAACHICRPHKARTARKPYLYAQCRGNEVSVCGARGKVRFTIKFDEKVVSAIVKDGFLVVTTADDCVRRYDAATSKLIAEIWPTPPEGGSAYAAFPLAA